MDCAGSGELTQSILVTLEPLLLFADSMSVTLKDSGAVRSVLELWFSSVSILSFSVFSAERPQQGEPRLA